MSSASPYDHRDADEITELQRQLHRYSNGIEEFEAMGAELKSRRSDPRVTEMIRINAETIRAMRRSAELVQERLRQAELRVRLATREP